jgi:hypothetical protein
MSTPKTRNTDTCELCYAEGPDKRSLFIRCFYAVDEVLPEAKGVSSRGARYGVSLAYLQGVPRYSSWYSEAVESTAGSTSRIPDEP